jgi:hypothetical protein
MRVGRSAAVTAVFLLQISPLVLLIAHRARLHDWVRRHMYLLAILAMQLVYNMYVGGEAWEWWSGSNRFVSVAMPLLFVMASTSLVDMLRRPVGSASVAGWTVASAVILNFLAFSSSPLPAWKRTRLLSDR